MLPPEEKDAILLVTQDFNGFNAGMAIYRVCHQTATFLARTIALEHHNVDPGADTKDPDASAEYTSDQYALGRAMQRYKDVSDRTYEIPQNWFNSYEFPPEDPESGDAADQGEDGMEGYQEWLAADRLQLQVHLAGPWKISDMWLGWYKLAEEVYRAGCEIAKERGVEGNGLDLLLHRYKAEEAARSWWAEAKAGAQELVIPGF
jgi:hypothetical protein